MKVVAILLLAVAYARAQSNCGVQSVDPIEDGRSGRIVNGIEARAHSWPWQVAMCRGTGQSCNLVCGGTVIRNNWILTAAHCVVGMSPSAIGWKYGAHSLRDSSTQGQGIAIASRFIPHPRYNSQQITSDIAVVELREALTYGDTVQPICVADTDDHLGQDTQVYDIGWGRLGGSGSIPDKLQQTILNHHSRENCRTMFQGLGHALHDTVSCAGGLPDLKSVCFGDSGGPYFKKDSSDNRYYQYGINSFVFSSSCAQEGRPNGFGRIAAMCDFLSQHVGDGICITPAESRNRFAPLGDKAPMWFA